MNRIGECPGGSGSEDRWTRWSGIIIGSILRTDLLFHADNQGDPSSEKVLSRRCPNNLFGLLSPERREVVKKLSLRKRWKQNHADLSARSGLGKSSANLLYCEDEGRCRVRPLGRKEKGD
jgi:hypothetical protein